MNRTEEIIEEYRHSSAEKRLALFLTYRELRDIFEEIDRQFEPAKEENESPIPTFREWRFRCLLWRWSIRIDRA